MAQGMGTQIRQKKNVTIMIYGAFNCMRKKDIQITLQRLIDLLFLHFLP